MIVTQIDIYNKEGNLVRIEVFNAKGEFVMQFLWDEHDEQTSDNRVLFREWVNRHIKQMGYEVHE
jgi:hypothetical protein